jgi:hypothetical protein
MVMTFPDNPNLTNIEPALPELPALRQLSRRDVAHVSVRRAIKLHVRQTLQHGTVQRGRSATSARPFLIAAAFALAVPGALAATEVGRGWMRASLDALPWTHASVENEHSTAGPHPRRDPNHAAPTPSIADSVVINPETTIAPPIGSSEQQRNFDIRTGPPTPATSATSHKSAMRTNSTELSRDLDVRSQTSAVAISPQVQAERRVLESARLALARSEYAQARYWCEQHRTRFATPVLEQERLTIERLVTTGSTKATPTKP